MMTQYPLNVEQTEYGKIIFHMCATCSIYSILTVAWVNVTYGLSLENLLLSSRKENGAMGVERRSNKVTIKRQLLKANVVLYETIIVYIL